MGVGYTMLTLIQRWIRVIAIHIILETFLSLLKRIRGHSRGKGFCKCVLILGEVFWWPMRQMLIEFLNLQ